jgi:hypothetical protein
MSELPSGDDHRINDHKVLRVLAKDAIRAGRLPHRQPDRVRDGPTDGATCTVCLVQISPKTMGYELEFAVGDGIRATHVLHIPCLEAWEAECESEIARTRATNGAHDGHANRPIRPAAEDSR